LTQKAEWLPYFAPMVAFAIVLAASDYFEGQAAALLALRFAAPLLVFLFFLSRGSYPELSGFRPGWGGFALDVFFGLLVMGVWVAPYLIWPSLAPASEAFDPAAAGEGWRPVLLALRFAGFVVVTPFIEELLVRSYLIRAVDIYPSDRDFREIPVGTFAWRSFLVTVGWFTLTHAEWEWPVALLAGVLYNLWLYRRKHIASLVIAHAVTNASLFLLVVWGAADANTPAILRDLWFFL
jgi:CAAX prenyl protease-like protein